MSVSMLLAWIVPLAPFSALPLSGSTVIVPSNWRKRPWTVLTTMWSTKKLTELCAGSTLYVSNATAVDAIKALTAQIATIRVILIVTISPSLWFPAILPAPIPCSRVWCQLGMSFVPNQMAKPSMLLVSMVSILLDEGIMVYKIAFTTPPSARIAAPLMATASGEQTKTTTLATSAGSRNRLSRDDGRTFLKNSFSKSAGVMCCWFASWATNVVTPSDAVGPASTLFTVTPVPAQPSADRKST